MTEGENSAGVGAGTQRSNHLPLGVGSGGWGCVCGGVGCEGEEGEEGGRSASHPGGPAWIPTAAAEQTGQIVQI